MNLGVQGGSVKLGGIKREETEHIVGEKNLFSAKKNSKASFNSPFYTHYKPHFAISAFL